MALKESGFNTSPAQPINHWQALQTNHLLMERHSHEFLIAFVLFNSPDQTEKIQTCWKGRVQKKKKLIPEHILLFGSLPTDIDGGGQRKREEGKVEAKRNVCVCECVSTYVLGGWCEHYKSECHGAFHIKSGHLGEMFPTFWVMRRRFIDFLLFYHSINVH